VRANDADPRYALNRAMHDLVERAKDLAKAEGHVADLEVALAESRDRLHALIAEQRKAQP
jgi:hypothetical protein